MQVRISTAASTCGLVTCVNKGGGGVAVTHQFSALPAKAAFWRDNDFANHYTALSVQTSGLKGL
jgi:hypothetical protein